MKKIILFVAYFIAIVSLKSCSNDDNSSQDPTENSSISATINGQPWETTIAVAALQSVNFNDINGSVLQIIGTKLDNTTLAINIPLQNLSIGTYTYNGINADGSLSYNSMSSSYFSDELNGSFTITINSYNITNGTISGTFSGNLIDFANNSNQISVTNGTFNNIKVYNQQLYSNGNMSLKLNNGAVFSMDSDNSDNKFIQIQQVNEANKLVIYGYNSNIGADFGVYSIMIPKNATPGTYTLDGTNYDAGFNNNNGIQYTTTGGSITITSNSSNNVVGTFNFTANGNSQNMTISNGSFNINYN